MTVRDPLRINFGFLTHQPIGSSREIHFDLVDHLLEPDLQLGFLKGVIRLNRTHEGVIADGDFEGNVQTECARCLENFTQPLHTTFQELYTFKGDLASEPSMLVPEDGNIEFAPLVREYLLVEMPINPICRPDCKGLCVVCGENLNLTTCEHQKPGKASD
ncbi:MAG TPA: DUF177 domain-containing protein [Longilinea sp.]|nr:DUF177 domain-containing protein [Longilinea sp.]